MSPQDLVGETFISVPETFAPTLRVVIDDYLKNRASTLRPITK